MGLRSPNCWDRGLESRRGHGCLSLVRVVRCQVEVSATGRSLVQRSPTDCGVCVCVCVYVWLIECDLATSKTRGFRPTGSVNDDLRL